MNKKFNLAILISGGGSNMEAIVTYFKKNYYPNLTIKIVLSDQKEAKGIKKAKHHGIEAKYIYPGEYKTKLSGEAEANYIKEIKARKVNLIVLAGFMRVLKSRFIQAFPEQIINIHPSLLPHYPGLNTHQRALNNQEKETGCTVHFVDEGIDTGRILGQKRVPILKGDTKESINLRVIKEEHKLYPKVIEKIISGRIPDKI